MLDHIFDCDSDLVDQLSKPDTVNNPRKMDIRLGSPIPKVGGAEIPSGKLLSAVILGVDEKSYFYVRFMDDATKERYNELTGIITEWVRGQSSISADRLQKRVHCIIESGGGNYSRGIISKVKPDPETVTVLLYDEFKQEEVKRSHIFETNEHIMKFKQFVLQCKLIDLDCFLGYPFLKHIFQAYLKKTGGELGRINCNVKIEDHPRYNSIPTVDITFPGKRSNLTFALQEYLPTLGKVEYPAPSVVTKVNIAFVEESGVVWYQNHNKVDLLDMITDILNRYDLKRKTHNRLITLEEYLSWKHPYLLGENRIYVGMNPTDKHFYRVTLNDLNEKGDFIVTYIDYGHDGHLAERNIHCAFLIDPNLCFIPPQCLPIRFSGMKYNIGPKLDQSRFWKYARYPPFSIVLKDTKSSGSDSAIAIPEADILARTPYSSADRKHPGHSLEEVYRFLGAAADFQKHIKQEDDDHATDVNGEINLGDGDADSSNHNGVHHE
ncbi:unnamed protein product [Orchesella dallaii]|uniref:Tudor domain-containing protein n=1 Tax=Orchesella dallaii TaxID=48710 RepID=A0ABP1QLQ1_9HEXA